MSGPGRFITFEGIEGVGKSTQVAAVATALRARGIEAVVTREPGGTPLAERLRELVLQASSETLPPAAELLLMFAARSVHLANLIEPCLQRGNWLLCDRFTDATYAYQGSGRGVNEATIATLETLVQAGRRPDLTLLLDLPVDVALQRVRHRNGAAVTDRFDSERAGFFERVRAGYLTLAARHPERIVIVDAAQPPAATTAAILAVLESAPWRS